MISYLIFLYTRILDVLNFQIAPFRLFTKVNYRVLKTCQIVNGKRYFGEWFFMITFVLKNIDPK